MTTTSPVTNRVVPASDVIDRRTIELIQRYAHLAGGLLERMPSGLMRLEVPADDVRYFGGRAEHFLAADVESMDRHPDAELPVIGGSFWNGLVAAVRARGGRCVEGVLPMNVSPTAEAPDVPVRDVTVTLKYQAVELHGVVRLAAKLRLTAGTMVEEELVESDVLDLVVGQPVPLAVSEAFERADATWTVELPRAPSSPAEQLVPALVRSLERKVEPRIRELKARAERDLAHELSRIDRYYATVRAEVLRESGSGSTALRTVEHEHEKRRNEEITRHHLRVEVDPVQALERTVAAQRVTWTLTSHAGVAAEVQAQRYLTGDGGWGIRCQHCGEAPGWLTVCRGGHAVGGECVTRCSVCGQDFCPSHGFAGCAIDGAPTCSEDAQECFACGRIHCMVHRARCDDGGHDACIDCVAPCAVCSRAVCTKHAVVTKERSPRGPRRLCGACVTYCEGATSEPIGVDEAAPCGTCGRDICERHQVRCVVDKMPHCSKHMARADRSRRFMCEKHRAACDYEPDLLFASDEVASCVECGTASCNRHGASCHEDQRWHCLHHLSPLHDVAGAVGCASHRSTCHIDGRTFSLKGTMPCPICAQATCKAHLAFCSWCGTSACSKDMQGQRCVTCNRLAPNDDPPDELVAAAAGLTTARVRGWQVARDAARYVVQLDLGWTRKIVFSVWHGSAVPSQVMKHSALGSSRLDARRQ